MNLKSFFKSRTVGFWITAAASAAALITAVVYGASYASDIDFSLTACLLVAACAAVFALSFTPFKNLTPYLQLLISLTAFCFYVYSVYYYVSVVLVGIDLDSFSARFIICTILYIATVATSAVSVFFRQDGGRAERAAECGGANV